MSEELETAVLQFLQNLPKKRNYANVREIAMGVMGKYPPELVEREIKKICETLWEHHLVDSKTIRKTYYRVKKAALNSSTRESLTEQYKEAVIEMLAKNKDWILRSKVIDTIIGPDVKGRDARAHLAKRSIGTLTRLGTIKMKHHGVLTQIRLPE